MKYQYKVKGIEYEVDIKEVEGNMAKVTVNGKDFDVEIKKQVKKKPVVKVPVASVNVDKKEVPVRIQETKAKPEDVSGTPVTAPLPGTISAIKVKAGDQVKKGDVVVVLEAMKMQNGIEAEADGVVSSVAVSVGQAVSEGDLLVSIG